MANLPTTMYEIYVQRQKSSWTVRRDNKYQPPTLPVGQRWLHEEGAPKLGRKTEMLHVRAIILQCC